MPKQFRDFTKEQRDELAKSGAALPDGSYPMVTVADLRNAISAFGRNPTARVKAHIVKRAKALGKTDLLPADWKGSTKQAAEMMPCPDCEGEGVMQDGETCATCDGTGEVKSTKMAEETRTVHYFKKLHALLKEKFQNFMSEDDFMAMVKTARGHAGGVMSAKKKKESMMASEDIAAIARQMAEVQHTGLLVSIWLGPESAKPLAVEGGEPWAMLHITLCYCGDASELGDVMIAKVITRVAEVCEYQSGLDGTVSGFGRFKGSESSDNMDVLYASADIPGLSSLRNRLADCLSYCGASPRTDHDFTPHITLAYLNPDDPTPIDSLPDVDLKVRALTVSVGDKRVQIPFGMAGMMPMQMENSIYAASEFRLFSEVQCGEPPDWIQLFPKPGDYTHPKYGELNLTSDTLKRIVTNFKDLNYQGKLPIDTEHDDEKLKKEGAFGWIEDLRQNKAGAIEAKVSWTDLGTEALTNDRYRYISADWVTKYIDPKGEEYSDVLRGAALTVRPFFKDKYLKPVLASEGMLYGVSDQQSADAIRLNDFEQRLFLTAFEPVTTKEVTMPDRDPAKAGMNEAEAKKLSEVEAANLKLTEEIATLKTANEQATAKLTEAEANNKQLSERVSVMEKDARRVRFTEIAKDFKGLSKTEDHVKFMEFIADKDPEGEKSEQLQSYITQQRAASEQLKAGGLFSEVGHDAPGGAVDAQTQLAAIARKLKEDNPKLSEAQAYTEACTLNPSLYEQHKAETRRTN